MRKSDIVEINVKTFKLVNDVLTKIRTLGVDFEEPVDNIKYMSANFIKYLIKDTDLSEDYLYLSLEASVDGFKSMVDGFVFNKDSSSKEAKQLFKEFKDSCSDINVVTSSIIKGAESRYSQLIEFEDLMLKNIDDVEWQDCLSVERIKAKRQEKENVLNDNLKNNTKNGI